MLENFRNKISNKEKEEKLRELDREIELAGIKPVKTVTLEMVKKVGLKLSKKYSYFTLKRIPRDADSMSEVYGDLKIHYPAAFQALIDNHVIEIATFYARKFGKKEVLKYAENVRLKDLYATKAYCKREYFFENFPEIKFDRILYFSEKPLPEGVSLIPEYKTEVDGLPVKVNALPFDTGLIGWHDVNIPVMIIKSTPGQNKGFIQAKWDAEDIKDKKIEIYQKTVHKLKARLDTYNPRVEKYRIKAEEAETELVQTIKDIKKEKKLNIAKMYRDRINDDPRLADASSWSDMKPYLILIGVLIVILVGYFIWRFLQPMLTGPTYDSSPTANLYTEMFSIIKLLLLNMR